jgi:hypothetical protein
VVKNNVKASSLGEAEKNKGQATQMPWKVNTQYDQKKDSRGM